MDSSLPKFILDAKKERKYLCVRERDREADRLRRTETDRHTERQRQKKKRERIKEGWERSLLSDIVAVLSLTEYESCLVALYIADKKNRRDVFDML